MGGAKRERRVPSSTSCGSSPNFSNAARAAAFFAAKSSRVVLLGHRAMMTCARRLLQEREPPARSDEHTSELQSLMRISYAVFCLKKTHNELVRARNNSQSNNTTIS